MNPDPPFRIQIRKVEREEFTVYRWGEIEDGDIVKTYDKGVEQFGDFEHIVERTIDMFDPDADPADPYPWLRLWHNYGSHAHHPRADVVHPYLDRHLWGETGIVLMGALRGLVAPSSHVATVDSLHLGARGEQLDGNPLVVRYRIGDLPDGQDLRTASQIAKFTHSTAANIIRDTLDTYHDGYVAEYVDFDRFVIVGMFENIPHCRIELPYEDAIEINWDTYEPRDLSADASRYYNAGK